MLNKGMNYIIPPTCEPTVPLLGPFQIAGYAESIEYEFHVFDYNNEFVKYIIKNAQSVENTEKKEENIDVLEWKACKKFIDSFGDIKGYSDLLNALKKCNTSTRYWHLIDYVRACYDLYSLNYKEVRFRLDGLDCKYRWNIWNDIEEFVAEYINSDLMNLIRTWINNFDFGQLGMIGINITFESQLFIAILFCIAIREIKPNLFIIVGGGFVNSFINSSDSIGPLAKYCDMVCAEEGEALIWHLNEQQELNFDELRSLGELNGKNANFVKASDLCGEKLQVYPPTITKKQLSSYLSPSRVLPLRFTYQCYWGKCKFCTDKEYHDCLESRYDYSRMIQYCISRNQEQLFDSIYFLDSAIPAKVLKLFCQAIKESGAKFTWGTNSRFDKVFADEEFIKMLAEAGCTFIKFGLESGSQRVLELMNKGTKLENAAKIIYLCRKYKILVHTYVMFAYPGEKEQDREETKAFLLDDYSHPDNYNCSEFILYGTAPVAKELGHCFENIDNGEEGWHSSSYSFTDYSIKKAVSDMRTAFDVKYQPANILISTGHTTSLARKFTNNVVNKIVLKNSTELKLSGSVVYSKTNSESILGRWRRRDCFVYFTGDFAEYIFNNFNQITVEKAVKVGYTTDTLYELINEGFLEFFNYGEGVALPYNDNEQIEFVYGNKFNQLKWYGYYDAN